MQKYLVGLMALTLTFVPLASYAEYTESNKADFGSCHADPVYDQNFVGKAIQGARVRSIACMDGSKILTTLAVNAKVQVIGQTDGWYKVKLSDGTKGWVGSWLLAKTTDTSVATTKTKTTPVEPVKKTGSLSDAYAKAQTLSLSDLRALKEKVAGLISQMEKTEATKKEVSKEPVASNGTISVTGEVVNGAAMLRWKLNGMTSPQGFKVVVSKAANPVYPGNDYHYLSEPNTVSDIWSELGEGTYHFRVCEYLGGKCGVYSNDVTLQLHD